MDIKIEQTERRHFSLIALVCELGLIVRRRVLDIFVVYVRFMSTLTIQKRYLIENDVELSMLTQFHFILPLISSLFHYFIVNIGNPQMKGSVRKRCSLS